MATNDIWSMTNEELLQYFKGIPEYAKLQYESNPGYGRPVDEGGYSGYDAYGRTKDGLNVDRLIVGQQGNGEVGDAYMESPIYGGYRAQLTPVNKDNLYLAGYYDEAGNLTGAERHERDTGGWFGENIDWLAPALIGGLAFAGAGGLGSLGGAGTVGTDALTEAMAANIGGGGGLGGYTAGAVGAGTAAVDGGLGFAANNELAALASAEAGFGGSAGLAGIEAALAEGAGATAGMGSGMTDPYVDAGDFGAPANDPFTLKNAGKALRAAGLLSALTEGGGSDGGGGGSKGVNLIADHPITRTTNPVEYVTPQQAADYIKGKYTGTTPLTAERKYFNYEHGPVSYTNVDTGVTARLNPETGQYETINDPNKNPASTTTQEDEYVGAANGGLMALAHGGGVGHLGGYSDGGRLLRGPGDGVSDSIPATIGKKQPARLADGEFVIPARIVSELGNGSTEAGARQLYAMIDRIQKARRKSMGKGKIAKDTKARKLLPA